MSHDTTFSGYAARLRQFIDEQAGLLCRSRREEARFKSDESSQNLPTSATEGQCNALALSLFNLQFEHNPVLRRLCQHRGVTPASVLDWRQIPAVPTSAFKELEVTSLLADERTAVFHSSGTTEQQPSRHFHNAESLAVYEASLRPCFAAHLLVGQCAPPATSPQPSRLPDLRFFALTPAPLLAPHSSLAHMFDTVRRAFGAADSFFAGGLDASGAWTLDVDAVASALRECVSAQCLVVLLGTAFNFVHLLDALAARAIQFNLPAGSRVMETGGYKGRSRVIPKAELHALMTQRLGVPASHIVCEYGMSELSSQAYDLVIRPPASGLVPLPRCFHFPPWARAQIISPETGCEVAEGETGLIRVLDLANVRDRRAHV